MPLQAYVVAAALISSLVSLAGGIMLLLREESVRSRIGSFTAFAAGVLLATAFLDLLPEATAALEEHAFAYALAGFLTFYALERLIRSIHFHRRSAFADQPSTTLVLVGDTVHNVLDGIVIAAGFMLDVRTGIATAVAVAVHEIPQEIGDFAVLLHNGLKAKAVVLLNFWSALAAVAGALITLQIGTSNASIVAPLIGGTAGFFIYVAGADLIPDLQKSESAGDAAWLASGVAAVWILLPRA